ncbi:MAG: hypothetical protein AAF532_01960 [Planctomycetota bacterium]
MTFVGKILIVLQLVLSVSFLAFSAAIYTAETNWKTAHATVQQQLDDTRRESAAASETAANENAALSEELENVKNELSLTNEKLTDAETLAERQLAELDEVRSAYDRQSSLTTIAQEQAAAAENNATRVSELNAELQSVKTELLSRNRKLDDELYALRRQVDAMQQKQKAALARNADYLAILTTNGLSTDISDYPDLDRTPPPLVEGRVLNVQKPSRRGASEFVEISLGGDDGLKRGDTLYVFSYDDGGQYLGKIVLDEVEADRAVGTVVSKSKNGVIAEGQSVTTKL